MAIEFGIKDRAVGSDTHVVSVSGEVDLFTAPEFKQRVMAPIARGVEHVIVDLTDSTFRITGLDGVFKLVDSVETALGNRAEAA